MTDNLPTNPPPKRITKMSTADINSAALASIAKTLDSDHAVLTDIAETLDCIRSSLNMIAGALNSFEPWNVSIK